MFTKIREEKVNKKSCYDVTHYDINENGNKIILKEERVCARIRKISANTFIYLDKSNRIDTTFNSYLEHLKNLKRSECTIESVVYKLKNLFDFFEIFNYTYEDLKNIYVINKLINFLKKTTYIDKNCEMHFVRPICNGSYNQILSTIVTYLREIGVTHTPLFESKTVSIILNEGCNQLSMIKEKNIYAEKQLPTSYSTDKSFSEEQLFKILTYLDRYYQKDDFFYVLIYLYLYTGCRVGTALSLTEEDLYEKVDEYTGTVTFYIKFRNRLTNKKFQHVKRRMLVYDRNEYSSKKYRTEGYGFTKKIIPASLYYLLKDLIAKNYKIASQSSSKKEKFDTKAVADWVEERKPNQYAKHPYNHYIFLNSQLTPVSQVTICKDHMAKMFSLLGIKKDVGFKENETSHRFRHAMLTYYTEKGVLTSESDQLNFLGNKSRDTLAVYMNNNDEYLELQAKKMEELVTAKIDRNKEYELLLKQNNIGDEEIDPFDDN